MRRPACRTAGPGSATHQDPPDLARGACTCHEHASPLAAPVFQVCDCRSCGQQLHAGRPHLARSRRRLRRCLDRAVGAASAATAAVPSARYPCGCAPSPKHPLLLSYSSLCCHICHSRHANSSGRWRRASECAVPLLRRALSRPGRWRGRVHAHTMLPSHAALLVEVDLNGVPARADSTSRSPARRAPHIMTSNSTLHSGPLARRARAMPHHRPLAHGWARREVPAAWNSDSDQNSSATVDRAVARAPPPARAARARRCRRHHGELREQGRRI